MVSSSEGPAGCAGSGTREGIVMTEPHETMPLWMVEQRVADLEKELKIRSVSDPYARLYGGFVVVMVALSFMRIFEDVVVRDSGSLETRHYGSLWDLVGKGDDMSALGLVVLAALAVLLVMATFRVLSPALPATIAVLAALIAVMVIARPESGDPKPELADAGLAGVAILVSLAVLAAVHAAHLTSVRSGQPGAS